MPGNLELVELKYVVRLNNLSGNSAIEVTGLKQFDEARGPTVRKEKP